MTSVGIRRGLLHLVVLCKCSCGQVGRDPRLSGPALAAALAAGLASKGVAVTDFGPATTPAMFMSCILEGESRSISWGRHDRAGSQKRASQCHIGLLIGLRRIRLPPVSLLSEEIHCTLMLQGTSMMAPS